MVKRNFTKHLTNHNYLKQIMIGIAEREAGDKSRQGEKDLRKKEAGLMTGGRYPVQEEQIGLTDEQIQENKRRIREIARRLG